MFAPYCERHRSRVLLPTTAIKAMDSTDTGIVVYYECICGQAGIWRSRQSIAVHQQG